MQNAPETGGVAGAAVPSAAEHQRRFGWIEDFLNDGKFYLRSLTQRGNRAFGTIAILTIALGIGSATAIFSVGYALLYDAFPYQDTNEIWSPWVNFPPNENNNTTRFPRSFVTEIGKLPAVAEVMSSTRVLGGNYGLFIEGPDGRESYQSFEMSSNGFSFLGVPPLMGRWLGPQDVGEDGQPAPVVVLSYQAWQKFFPGDPNPINKTIEFQDNRGGGRPRTVVGVMPPRFGGQPIYDIGNTVWLPMHGENLDPAPPASYQVRPRVRLKPGISREVGEQQIAALFERLAKDTQVSPFWTRVPTRLPNGIMTINASTPWTSREFKTTLRDFVSATFDYQGVIRANFRYLSFGVGFLLLIACMNVANLKLSRAAGRTREIAVRLALGASRSRLIRQLLTESVILSVAGAALGIFVAYGFTKMTHALMPPNMFGGAPLPEEAQIGLNGAALAFAAIISVVSGLLFGLAPALQSSTPNLNESLKDGGRTGAGARGGKLRSILVVAEMAFSVVLLFAASFTLWGYVRLVRIDPGYNPDNMFTVYPSFSQSDTRMDEFVERSRALPLVSDISRTTVFGASSTYSIEGVPADENKRVLVASVDQDFLKTVGMTLYRGRNFTADEISRGDSVALIGRSAASQFWPGGEDPIGRQITVDFFQPPAPPSPPGTPAEQRPTPPPPPALTIIGIVGDLRPNVTQELTPFVAAPYTIRPLGSATLVRARSGELEAVQDAFQGVLSSMEPNRRIFMQDIASNFDRQFQLPRFNFVLFCTLAGIALTLAIAGVYSVLSYHISQRTKEFGVRLALGADRGNILRLVLKTGGILLGIGFVVGLGISVALARIVSSQTRIFTVNLDDSATLMVTAVGCVLLCLAAFAACLIPARRATKVDPLVALRAE